MTRVWQLAVSLGVAAALPALLPHVLLSRKRRRTVLGRLTLSGLPRPAAGPRAGRIWVHALSVGETVSAVPLVRAMGERFPDRTIHFSASTETGFAEARRLLEDIVSECFLFPYDLPVPLRRVWNRVDPGMVVLVETDIWPGFLGEAEARSIPVVLVNTRLSDRSFAGYRRFSGIMGSVLRKFARICPQTDADVRRFRALGVSPDRIVRTGNIKFDSIAGTPDAAERATLRKRLGLEPSRRILVAGSTHEGEEAMLAAAFRTLIEPGLRAPRDRESAPALVIAPRAPDRAEAVRRIFAKSSRGRSVGAGDVPHPPAGGNLAVRTLAETEAGAAADVIVVDRIGVLRSLYALGEMAFVGGSLVPRGGHNPLEPAACGVPVLFGPHMHDFREIARMLLDAGGAKTVDSAAALASAAGDWLRDPERARRAGERARTVFLENRGAVDRTLDALAGLLPPLPPEGAEAKRRPSVSPSDLPRIR